MKVESNIVVNIDWDSRVLKEVVKCLSMVLTQRSIQKSVILILENKES